MAPELLARKREVEACVRQFRASGELSEAYLGWRAALVGDAFRERLERGCDDVLAPQRRHVRVYRSSRKQEMYLYVDAEGRSDRVPQALLTRFGKPVEALSLLLTADRVLARADAARVLADIDAQGFYLQMPPRPRPGRRHELLARQAAGRRSAMRNGSRCATAAPAAA
jgi:uncharacterized protein